MKQYVAILLMFLLAAPAQASVQLPSPRTMRALEAPFAIPGRADNVRRGAEPRRTPEFARTTGYDATMRHAGARNCRIVLNFIGYDDRNNRTAYAPFNGTSRGFAWTYDLANRVLTERNSLNLGPTYTYDAAGRRLTTLDANGQLTTFGYDDNGRLLTVTFSDATQNEFAYDSRGNRTLEKSPNHERHLQYDELNRLKQVDDITFGRTIVYGYDANGNRTSITEGGVTQRFEYDSRNLLISAREGSSPAVQLKYDALGRRTAIIRPNGVRSDFVFDDASQVSSITHSKGGVALLAFGYQYDGDGMRTRKTREDGSYEIYGYDTSRRLTSAKYSSGRNISYGLDVWGNWFDVFDSATPLSGYPSRYTTNAFNQVTSISNFGSTLATFIYDNNGNTLSETRSATFGGGTTTYDYSKDNRLLSVASPAGVTSYQYSASGLRTRRVDASGTVGYLLDGSSVFAELDSVGAVSIRYLNNPQAIDDVFAHVAPSGTTYPLTDALGTVYALTDASGVVVRSQTFEVYGERSTTTGTGPTTSRGFTGRWHDANGLIEHRDRQRNPRLGTWLGPDRAGNIDGPNRYQYAGSNPGQFTDPSGQFIQAVVLVLLLAVLLAGDDPSGPTLYEREQEANFWRFSMGLIRTLPRPPEADIDANIAIAEGHRGEWTWFRDQVKSQGPWDYWKGDYDLAAYAPFGNFNYGATGLAVGFSENTLLRAAGLYQRWTDNYAVNNNILLPDGGQPTLHPGNYFDPFGPYGDDPEDQAWINLGFQYYHFKWEGGPSHCRERH